MRPSRTGVEYLLPIFTNAIGHADVEYTRESTFDAGTLSFNFRMESESCCDWFELKLDGARIQVHKSGGEVRVYAGRSGDVQHGHGSDWPMWLLDVRLKDGSGSFLGWDRLYVNVDPLASIIGSWSVGEIELDGLRRAREGRDTEHVLGPVLAQVGEDLRLHGIAARPAVARREGEGVQRRRDVAGQGLGAGAVRDTRRRAQQNHGDQLP